MVKHKRKIFCLMGPTASGKSDLAIQLAKILPFEIISVDSAMIYRGMDIGTAKPTPKQLQSVPHHLIDICDPKEIYSAGKFREDALAKIDEIYTRDMVPLLVGGTMLYFRVLQQGLSHLPKSDEKVRTKIKALLDKEGLEALYLKLQEIDPETAKQLKITDQQRIQRALEVYEITGKSLSSLKFISPPKALPYESVNVIVAPKELSDLRDRIKLRFQKMIDSGFVEEVRKLYERGDLHQDLPSIRTVGYRQIWQYLAGEISYEKMLELVPIATGQLAKRQLTWLKRWAGARWFHNEDPQLMFKITDLIRS